MRMTITRNSIVIIPENDQDKAFIEDTLKLEHENEYIKLYRKAPMGLPSAIAYLEATFGGGDKK
jgi:hypothetical protein